MSSSARGLKGKSKKCTGGESVAKKKCPLSKKTKKELKRADLKGIRSACIEAECQVDNYSIPAGCLRF